MKRLILKAIVYTSMALSAGLCLAGPVDINRADAQSLVENIKGVGPKIAQRIVDYRTANGPFEKVEDLQQVQGIGEEVVNKNRDVLLINTSTNLQ